MASSIGKSMSRMRSGTSSAMSGMATTVGRAFSGMRSSAATSTSGLASSVGSAMSRAASSVRISGLNASRSYVSSMSSLRSGAIGQATGAALGVQRRLRFSASGAGSYVGSTYRSGLSGSTLGAIGVAAGAALSVRARLSINAHSSGASIGSTFANGIRSRIGAVMAAASALAGAARRMLPNSPAKDGPFSGSGWGGWGESIAEELARGIRNGASEVTREAAYMMNGVASEMGRTFETGVNVNARASRYTPLYGGGAQAPAGASNVTVNVTSNSDEPLREGARFAKDVAFQLKGLSI